MRKIVVCLAFTLFTSAAYADFNAGMAAFNKKDYATALKEWKPLASRGNAGAQNNLGVMYENARGVPQDDKEAERLYRLSANQGNASAQLQLTRVASQSAASQSAADCDQRAAAKRETASRLYEISRNRPLTLEENVMFLTATQVKAKSWQSGGLAAGTSCD